MLFSKLLISALMAAGLTIAAPAVDVEARQGPSGTLSLPGPGGPGPTGSHTRGPRPTVSGTHTRGPRPSAPSGPRPTAPTGPRPTGPSGVRPTGPGGARPTGTHTRRPRPTGSFTGSLGFPVPTGSATIIPGSEESATPEIET